MQRYPDEKKMYFIQAKMGLEPIPILYNYIVCAAQCSNMRDINMCEVIKMETQYCTPY